MAGQLSIIPEWEPSRILREESLAGHNLRQSFRKKERLKVVLPGARCDASRVRYTLESSGALTCLGLFIDSFVS